MQYSVEHYHAGETTSLIAFLDCRGIVHKEVVPEGQTANQDFYLSVLQLLCLSIRHHPELWTSTFRNTGKGVSMQGKTISKGTNSNNV
jgi:hypothetical protein